MRESEGGGVRVRGRRESEGGGGRVRGKRGVRRRDSECEEEEWVKSGEEEGECEEEEWVKSEGRKMR